MKRFLWLILAASACHAPSAYERALDEADAARRGATPSAVRGYYERAAALAEDEDERAEALFRAALVKIPGEKDEAVIRSLDALAAEFPRSERAPRALLEAGRRLERVMRYEEARRRYQQIVATYPGSSAAPRAIDSLLRLSEEGSDPLRKALALTAELERQVPLERELILFRRGQLQSRAEPHAAIKTFEQLGREYPLPQGRYTDEALLASAKLRLQLGDAQGAERILAALMEARTRSLMVGSYDRLAYAEAAFLRARVYTEFLGAPEQGIESLRRFARDFPRDRLRDDAIFWAARWLEAKGDRAAACQELRRLANIDVHSRFRRCEPTFCGNDEAPAPPLCTQSLPPLGVTRSLPPLAVTRSP